MKLALYGDGNNFGFLYIIDEYSGTPSANLANYYAGIAFLNLSEYDNAIKHLKSFSSNDVIISQSQMDYWRCIRPKGDIEKVLIIT